MTAAELAKMLMEHPEWEVEIEGTTTCGCEPEHVAMEADVFEYPERKKFLLYGS